MEKQLIFKPNRKHCASNSDFIEIKNCDFRHEGDSLHDGVFCRKAHIFLSISRNTHPGLDHYLANREKRLSAFQIEFSAFEEDVSVPRTDVSVVEEDALVPRTDVSVVEEDASVSRTDVSVVEEDVSVPRTNVSVVEEDVSVTQTLVSVAQTSVPTVKQVVLIEQGDVPVSGAYVSLIHSSQNNRGEIVRPWRYSSR